MKTPISFKSLNLVCKQNTFWNVKRDIRRRENTATEKETSIADCEALDEKYRIAVQGIFVGIIIKPGGLR